MIALLFAAALAAAEPGAPAASAPDAPLPAVVLKTKAPRPEDGRVRLLPGQMVTLKFVRTPVGVVETTVLGVEGAEAMLSPEAQAGLLKQPAPGAPARATPASLEVPAKDAGIVRIAFIQKATDSEAVLVVVNGADRPLTYRATMTLPWGKTETTGVCDVAPGKQALEHWPHAVAAFDLDRFNLGPRQGGSPATCQ